MSGITAKSCMTRPPSGRFVRHFAHLIPKGEIDHYIASISTVAGIATFAAATTRATCCCRATVASVTVPTLVAFAACTLTTVAAATTPSTCAAMSTVTTISAVCA
jgi:hypothetical protein